MKSASIFGVAFFLFACSVTLCEAQSSFSGKRLESAVMDFVRQELGQDCEVLLSQSIGDQKFGEDGITANISGDAASIRKMKSVGLEFLRDGQLIRRTEIPLRIRLYQLVPRAAKNLLNGNVISEEDIVLAKVDVSLVPNEDIPAKEELIGKSLRRPVARGGILTRSAIAAAAGVRRGEHVAILVQAGTVSVSASGKAMEDGVPGDMIRVSREGGSILTAKILENGTVLITP